MINDEEKLQKLLDYVSNNNEFYKKHGISNGLLWENAPMIDRSTVQKAKKRILSQDYLGLNMQKIITLITSGSSGEPLRVYWDPVDYYNKGGNDLDEFESDKYMKFVGKINKNSNLQKKDFPKGMCIPGRDKLYVTVNGDFYPCEKINENNKYIKIGNLTEGFNETKIKELISLPKITERECKKCWAFRFCEICIAHCEDFTCGLSREAKLQECKNQKQMIERFMIRYIMEKERSEK